MFIIMCERSGGSAGYGRAPLKYHGKVARYYDRGIAEETAARITRDMNGRYAVGRYRYWVEEENGDAQ